MLQSFFKQGLNTVKSFPYNTGFISYSLMFDSDQKSQPPSTGSNPAWVYLHISIGSAPFHLGISRGICLAQPTALLELHHSSVLGYRVLHL